MINRIGDEGRVLFQLLLVYFPLFAFDISLGFPALFTVFLQHKNDQPPPTMPGLPPVFGAGCINDGRAYTTASQLPELFSILKAGGCTHIDTAALYGTSEELLGQAGAGQHFTLDTKTKGGFIPGYATKENVIKDAENSRKLLGCTVDVFYIHAPDMEHTPLEETLEGVNEVYKSGFFKRFGLSNYKAEDVQKVYDICKEKRYPLPTVYQGNCRECLSPLPSTFRLIQTRLPHSPPPRNRPLPHPPPPQHRLLRLLSPRRRLPHQIPRRHRGGQRPLRPVQSPGPNVRWHVRQTLLSRCT